MRGLNKPGSGDPGLPTGVCGIDGEAGRLPKSLVEGGNPLFMRVCGVLMRCELFAKLSFSETFMLNRGRISIFSYNNIYLCIDIYTEMYII